MSRCPYGTAGWKPASRSAGKCSTRSSLLAVIRTYNRILRRMRVKYRRRYPHARLQYRVTRYQVDRAKRYRQYRLYGILHALLVFQDARDSASRALARVGRYRASEAPVEGGAPDTAGNAPPPSDSPPPPSDSPPPPSDTTPARRGPPPPSDSPPPPSDSPPPPSDSPPPPSP